VNSPLQERMKMELAYRGKGLLFLRNVFAYVALAGAVLSLCLMGPWWFRTFLSLMILSFVLLPAAAFLISRLDRFSLDDEKLIFRKSSGRNIPYAGITRIEVQETSGLVKVVLKRGRFNNAALISTLDAKDKASLLEALGRRLPEAAISEKHHVDWKSLLWIIAIMFTATAAFHGYLYSRHPALSVRPQRADWTAGEASRRNQDHHDIGSYRISLPPEYRYRGREGDVLFFESRDKNRTEIKIASLDRGALPSAEGRVLKAVTGYGHYADMLEKAYTARFGIVPLVIKDFSLTGSDEVLLFSVALGNLHGTISQGKRKGKELTDIVLSDRSGNREIMLFISGPIRLDGQKLRAIADGIELRR
jgi:hypothetical protein